MPRKILVIDGGLFMQQAMDLAKDGSEVRYWTNWCAWNPKFEEFAVGKGFEDKGFKKVLYWADHVEWADCIVNFDVHMQDVIDLLRRKYPEKSIVGSGKGEKLENDRWGLKRVLKDIGMKVQKTKKCKGVTELRNYLKQEGNKFVKLNIFRETMESFYAKDYESVELLIDNIEEGFGPFKEEYEFIVEDCIDAPVEIGFDGFFNGTELINPYFSGIEFHKNLYVAKITDVADMPAQIKETMDALTPVLGQLGWRGPISTEELLVNKKEHYFLDICARMPSPLSALYGEYILNYGDMMYKIGKGEKTSMDITYKYVGAFSLQSAYAKTHWLDLHIDEKDRKNIKLSMGCYNNGRYYAVKGFENVCTIIAGGSSVDEVLKTLKKYAHRVSAYGLDNDAIEGIDKIKEVIEKGKKVGVNF